MKIIVSGNFPISYLMTLIITAVFASVAFAGAVEKVSAPVLSIADDANSFKAHIGHVVSLSGRLGLGKQGDTLLGATPDDVGFYLIDDPSGSYTSPAACMQLGHLVRVTGELKFRSFDRRLCGGGGCAAVQPPPRLLLHGPSARSDSMP